MKMEFKLIFLWIFLIFGDYYLVETQESPDLIDTTPDVFPFQAAVHARMVCGGVLISDRYVITPGYCVYNATKAKVYLGFKGYPYFASNHSEPNTQIYHVQSNNIFIHEDFARFKSGHYLNNIAVIKFTDPVTTSDVVQPGKLISREDTHLIDGRIANISGWRVSKDEGLKYVKVQLRNQDTCGFLFGNQFLRSQELCVKWPTETRLNLLGNAVTVGNTIIGFQTNTPPCAISSKTCSGNDMVLNLLPFLDWISYKTNIPLNEFTSINSREYNRVNISAKIKYLSNRIEEILNDEKSFYKKYELDLKTLNEKIENTANEFESGKREKQSFSLKMNEAIGAVNSEINSTRVKNDQNILKLQEKVDGARSEVSLDARQRLADFESKFQNLNKSIQQNKNEKIGNIQEQFRDLLDKTETSKIEVNDRFEVQDNIILSTGKKLHEVDNIVEKERLELVGKVTLINSLVGNLTSSFTNLSSNQRTLQEQRKGIIGGFKAHLSKEYEFFYEMGNKLSKINNIVEKNSTSNNLRFDELEKVFGDQQHRFDKHILTELTEIQSLWVAIQDLNVTIGFIGNYFQIPYIEESLGQIPQIEERLGSGDSD